METGTVGESALDDRASRGGDPRVDRAFTFHHRLDVSRMSFWADSFCEVCYRARQFAMTWEEVHYDRLPARLYEKLRLELAEDRMHLECAMATYQLCRKGIVR